MSVEPGDTSASSPSTDEPSTGGAEAAVPTSTSVDTPGTATTTGDAPEPGTGVTPLTQEIRFATTMTGGVSLAIWMGGVARELNLLDRASRQREQQAMAGELGPDDGKVCELYRGLLELLDQVIRIDVLSGTSAGGINAALLGLCHARAVDLGLLRDIWLETAAFGTLLRDPTTKEPPSLMRGDGVLLEKLAEGIRRLAKQQSSPRNDVERDTVAFVTTSLLSGETSRFTDTYGTVVPDVDHLAIFSFPTTALWDDDSGLAALALAARSSASFPAAFEPAFLPFRDPAAADDGPKVRPAMAAYANITRPHWAADGGLLANRPLTPLLETVFERPADDRQVRRVLLYIVPDPGGAPDPRRTPEPDRIDRPHTLGQALLADLAATLNQSISADLEAIRRHNDRVDSQRDIRLRLAELGGRGVALTSATGRADFVRRESDAFVRLVVDRLMREVTSRPENELTEEWKLELAPGRSIEEACRAAARQRVSEKWNPDPTPGDYAALGELGRTAYDGALAAVLSLIRAGYGLATAPADRASLSDLSKRVHRAFVAGGRGDLDKMIEAGLDRSFGAVPGESLTAVAATLAAEYADERARGTTKLSDAELGSSEGPPDGLARAWWALAGLVEGALPLLRHLAGSVPARAEPPPADDRTLGARRARASHVVTTYLAYLGDDRNDIASRLLALHVAERSMSPAGSFVEQPVELIQVSATTRNLLDPARRTAQGKLTGTQFHHFGAFYKSSWRANDWMWGRLDGAGWLVHVLLDPRRILTIVESDAKGYPTGRRAETFLERLDALTTPRPTLVTAADRRKALEELHFLDDESIGVPTSLPATALWTASAWQSRITTAELPVVAREALANPSQRDNSWAEEVLSTAGAPKVAVAASRQAVAAVLSGRSAKGAKRQADRAASDAIAEAARVQAAEAEAARAQAQGAARAAVGSTTTASAANRPTGAVSAALSAAGGAAATSPLSPADERANRLAAQLRNCRVPDEKLPDEVGEPLMTRTLAKTVAVGTATLSSVRKPPTSLAALLATARTVTLTGYRAIGVAGAVPKRLIVAGLAASTAGVAFAVQGGTVLGMTGSVALLVGLYLIALGAWGLRGPWLAALGAATVVALLVTACVPWTRRYLFGTRGGEDRGWVTETLVPNVVPWMRDTWWSMPAVLGVLLGACALWVWAMRFLAGRVARRHPSPEAAR